MSRRQRELERHEFYAVQVHLDGLSAVRNGIILGVVDTALTRRGGERVWRRGDKKGSRNVQSARILTRTTLTARSFLAGTILLTDGGQMRSIVLESVQFDTGDVVRWRRILVDEEGRCTVDEGTTTVWMWVEGGINVFITKKMILTSLLKFNQTLSAGSEYAYGLLQDQKSNVRVTTTGFRR
ncbi:hypothetical protein IW261DRAFT_1418301 [Armillaria novae-zelandiae]|uniref:Uncharacterized protein n=1 Tax=Armillaria novae-zelandiae TaxID=153914 RepID=A0AA39UDI9_9AGAR|nr:hypothetical protein IW261DRAFT_1418301 [Armillaria novae-zelandiae]